MKNSRLLKGAGLAVLTLYLTSKLFRSLKQKSLKKSLHSKASRRNQQLQALIQQVACLPQVSPSLSSQILSSSISELSALLDSQKITCVDIFLSFAQTLRVSSAPFNCISDLSFAYGYKRAQKLDLELKSGQKRSRLHGIPISVKDMIAVKNMISSFGCMNESYHEISSDAELVKMLKKKGAIIFVKGTMSQNAASYETLNNITGRTLNPIDTGRSCGGSSGGDAVIVSTRGSCAAIGTDIGGSLRYPALCCNIYSLKPTSYRISRAGPLSLQDYPHLKNSWGPLCKSFSDLALISEMIFSEKPSSYLPYIPWKEAVYSDKSTLTISICYGSDYWPVPSAFKKALDKVKEQLVKLGHTVKDFELTTEIEEVTGITLKVLSYDPQDERRLAGEDLIAHLSKVKDALTTCEWFRPIKEKIIRWRKGEKESIYYKYLTRNHVDDYLGNIVDLRIFKEKFLKRFDSDILIFPYAVPAVLHDTSQDLFPGFSYMSIFNILDWPVGHLPTGFIEEDENYLPENQETWAQAMRKCLQNSKGLPVGVQISALPFQEEKVLRLMRELDSLNS